MDEDKFFYIMIPIVILGLIWAMFTYAQAAEDCKGTLVKSAEIGKAYACIPDPAPTRG